MNPSIITFLFIISFIASTALAETPITPAKLSELKVPMEPWAMKAKAYSGSLCEELCLCIQPEATVNRVEKKVWMSEAQGFKGILVLHPFSTVNPGLILFPVTTSDEGKTLFIKARSSDIKPGGKILIKNGETVLGESKIDDKWLELGVKIPSGATEIRIEWYAIGWDWEVLWIDEISVGL